MKNFYIALILTFTLSASTAHAIAISFACSNAVEMSCQHFDTGNGPSEGDYDVDWDMTNYPDVVFCEIYSSDTGIHCTLDDSACPDPPPAGVAGEDIPDVALCDSCGGETPFSGTINEAKCCLILGQPTGPNGEVIC